MNPPGAGDRRTPALIALAVGAVGMVAGVVLVFLPARGAPDVGELPAAPAASGSAPASAGTASATGSAPAPTPLAGEPLAARAPVPSPEPPLGSPPVRLTIAHLKVAAEVDPAGVGRGGRLDVPADPDRLGWWIGGATPAVGAGTVLIAGHVDTAADGRGVLFGVERLPMGALIEIEAGGERYTYRAVARRSYTKRRLPADLFRPDTPHRLVLVTCGGEFSAGSYARNVVLYADPVR